jgi:hypothetical protein
MPTYTVPLATTGEAVITGKGFDVSGWIAQTKAPVVALIFNNHPVGPGEAYCVPMYTKPPTTVGLVRENVPGEITPAAEL